MNPIRALFARLNRGWSRSIRRQLTGSFSLVALVITLGTGYLLFSFQRDFLYTQGTKHALDLAQSLSFSSSSWVLANDLAGLQEVLKRTTETTDIKFAVVVSQILLDEANLIDVAVPIKANGHLVGGVRVEKPKDSENV